MKKAYIPEIEALEERIAPVVAHPPAHPAHPTHPTHPTHPIHPPRQPRPPHKSGN